MQRLTSFFLLPLLAVSLISAASAQFVDLPHQDRVQVRAYGLWWLTYIERLEIETMFSRADKAFNEDSLHSAERQYAKMARYGDKFSQFRLGLIAIKQDRPAEAWAWFKLSGEGGVHDEFNTHADRIREAFSESQRSAADHQLSELSQEYSDIALARRLERTFRNQMRNSTGSRLGNTKGQNVTDGGNLSTADLYANIEVGLQFSEELIENYGNVYLREFEVIEPDEEQEAEPSQDPGPEQGQP